MLSNEDAMILNKMAEIGTKVAGVGTGVDSVKGDMSVVKNNMSKESTSQKILAKLSNGNTTPHGTQTFTENGTFTVPAGVTKILVTAFGGGGGGHGAAGGGGGERIIKKAYSVTPGTAISIKIGVGGTDAVAGGSTVIGSLVTVAGGISGNGTVPNTYKGTVGGYGEANGQDNFMAYGGKSGGNKGGGGGGAGYDNGGQGASYGDYTHDGGDGGIGAGGGGGGYGLYPERYGKGGKGGDGIVIIEW